jgi:hypothetical protein
MGLGNQYGPGSVSIPQAIGGMGKRGVVGKEINPNDISMLSIPKQTKFFVEAMRQRTE